MTTLKAKPLPKIRLTDELREDMSVNKWLVVWHIRRVLDGRLGA